MGRQNSAYESTKAYLLRLKLGGSDYDLTGITALCEALNHPERRFAVIHVAGTNGKGSVCAMLECLYREAGFKTGLYLSPHLVRLRERIQINRTPLSEEALIHHTRQLQSIACISEPSLFEFMTAMAFQHFAMEDVDIALIETGLGGRLDATNVVMPEAAVITSIAYDHQEILGNTLAAIAREKAGIIKVGRPVVIGRLCAEAEGVIREIARERRAPVHSVRERFGNAIARYPRTCLAGRCQRFNAATATLVAETLRFPVTETHVTRALQRVQWPGHWQRISLEQRKTLILDRTHNAAAMDTLEENLRQLALERRPIFIIIGTVGIKRAHALIPLVSHYATTLVLVEPQQPNATPTPLLKQMIPQSFKGRVLQASVQELFPHIGTCRLGDPGDILVATGSIYLIGELMASLCYGAETHESQLQDGASYVKDWKKIKDQSQAEMAPQ